METTIDVVTAILSLGAALFWFLSAAGKIPAPIAYVDHAPDDDPFFVALRRSARMNRVAAALSGLAAVTFALRLIAFS